MTPVACCSGWAPGRGRGGCSAGGASAPCSTGCWTTARDGHGGVLVVHGEPGVGKTALLEYAVEAGAGLPRRSRCGRRGGDGARLRGAAAALRAAPRAQRASRLIRSVRRFVVAFGQSAGRAPSPFLVGLAVLGLLSEAAEQQPLLCVVDDAQWLDRASARALAFVARRLLAERIALAFAARELSNGLGPLPAAPRRAVGAPRCAGAVGVRPRRRGSTSPCSSGSSPRRGGNPLALLELPRGLTPAQLAGGFGLPAALPLSARDRGELRAAAGAAPARRAAACCSWPQQNPSATLRFCGARRSSSGSRRRLRTPSESDGLLALDGAVAFRHPLVRSAVYTRGRAERAARGSPRAGGRDRSADRPGSTRLAPRAGCLRARRGGGRRARALRGACAGAGWLRRCGGVPRTRGHADARSGAPRAARAARGQTKVRAGALDDALGLLSVTEVGALDELDRARVELLRAQVAFVSTHGSEAAAMLLEAARHLTPLSPTLAAETYLEALSAAMIAGRLAAPGTSALDVALSAKAAPQPPILRGPSCCSMGSRPFSVRATRLPSRSSAGRRTRSTPAACP